MPTKEFSTSATIDASPEAVWSVLVDTQSWPQWDPFCEKIEGEVALGNKIKAFTKLSPGRAFAVKVETLEPNRKMVWAGGMPLGLFRGERTYALSPSGEGGTEFTMREVFSGPMLALIGKTIPDMSEAFDAFAQGLKKRAESG